MSDDVSAEIMAATYRALCEHGYADLTMQDIADETEKSKATLHYHYDSKRDLLLAFLEYLYDSFTERVGDPVGATPAERLGALLDAVLTPPEPEDHAPEAFGTAMLELKAQAPYDETVRERLQRFDAFLFDRVRTHVAAGVEDGSFRAVDPDDTARFVVTVVAGARTKQVAVGQDLACTRRMLRSYVETHLLDDSGETASDGSDEGASEQTNDGEVLPG